ncbi:MAG: putative sulfate exporter family transporter [Alphaproteobacteria bacterium]|nr:putative sulfate exporter family transporter [Alphaproteobacteria bacterium]MBU0798058.1 putative sulfate exporter family transporter [Alphaproteobacteria bacterium]MBU0888758.1 putative sulfate exporter family transporter [Alphaproteobacteria bacterium]MBU1812523.1 putative sulfate exporter family transporter [Alphaproteobacteria bacterium]MBU2091952.1 putative sulfate exporter family transporter [Alphaproteobacteria bacterium]
MVSGKISATWNTVQQVWPGVLVSLTVAIAATFLARRYGAPVMLFALLLGMALHFLSSESRCAAGVEFSSKKILRFGVALLGARITAEQILSLGVAPIVTVIAAVVLTILVGWVLARALGFDRQFGLLTAGAVAICGASAALAISAVLPKTATSERDTIFTVIGVTSLSTIAMVLYPVIVAATHLTDTEAGMFLGGTIHDVAQVVGAGYSVSQEAGDVATFTKLLRVAMLMPVVVIFAMMMRGQVGGGTSKTPALPLFLVAFALLVVVNSLGWIPASILVVMIDLSNWMLATAIAALGIKTSLKAMAAVGPRAIMLIVGETVFLALLVLGLLTFVL